MRVVSRRGPGGGGGIPAWSEGLGGKHGGMRLPRPLALVLPGLLVAATGVGAGDLAGATLAGSRLGVAVLWAVAVGAVLKFILSEGLTRWQLATGSTLLAGMCRHLGWPAQGLFLVYLLSWSLSVGLALISACGVATHALIPVFERAEHGKVVWGIVHSLLGLGLVWFGSFRLFETVMAACIAIMFVVMIGVALAIGGDPPALLRGLTVPQVPSYIDETGVDQGVSWTLALLGGVGGTLTILSYGYWIREDGREGLAHLRTCRIDLAVAYGATALFGMAMIVIAVGADLPKGKGTGLILHLAAYLEARLGATVAMIFTIGAWAAVFSSLLGVWQAVPYLFTDFVEQVRRARTPEAATEQGAVPTPYRGRTSYRAYLLALALLPMLGLFLPFAVIQRIYGVLGSLMIPLVAVVLLLMTLRRAWIGEAGRTRWLGVVGLTACLVIYGWISIPELLAGGGGGG